MSQQQSALQSPHPISLLTTFVSQGRLHQAGRGSGARCAGCGVRSSADYSTSDPWNSASGGVIACFHWWYSLESCSLLRGVQRLYASCSWGCPVHGLQSKRYVRIRFENQNFCDPCDMDLHKSRYHIRNQKEHACKTASRLAGCGCVPHVHTNVPVLSVTMIAVSHAKELSCIALNFVADSKWQLERRAHLRPHSLEVKPHPQGGYWGQPPSRLS